jgi:hypothetical protein
VTSRDLSYYAQPDGVADYVRTTHGVAIHGSVCHWRDVTVGDDYLRQNALSCLKQRNPFRLKHSHSRKNVLLRSFDA